MKDPSAGAFQASILLMLAMPFLLLGAFGVAAWRLSRRRVSNLGPPPGQG